MEPIRVECLSTLSSLEASRWDELAGGKNPFVSYAFLKALEDSQTATAETGWKPSYLVASSDQQLLAAAPLYVKAHSYGEYVFDWSWANAYQQLRGSYYPKLQVAVPFTPVPGPRLLGQDEKGLTALGVALVELTERLELSSAHVTFCQQHEAERLESHGFQTRLGQQYHWFNQDFDTFEDFLGSLSSRKRKAIRRERRKAQETGLTIEVLTGSDITEEILDHLFLFYLETSSRKWGRPYLNRDFFSLVHQNLPHQLILVMAREQNRWVAGAWNLRGQEALFGRNWGCIGFYDCLHFEVCYYQAIEFAIAHQLARVEAGAQGLHKVQRGYQPLATYSAHYLRDPDFRGLIAGFLREEKREVQADLQLLEQRSPFKQ